LAGQADKWLSPTIGHGVLAYPGNDGLPIPSLRLLNLRDGMQDWALAVMPARRASGSRQEPA